MTTFAAIGAATGLATFAIQSRQRDQMAYSQSVAARENVRQLREQTQFRAALIRRAALGAMGSTVINSFAAGVTPSERSALRIAGDQATRERSLSIETRNREQAIAAATLAQQQQLSVHYLEGFNAALQGATMGLNIAGSTQQIDINNQRLAEMRRPAVSQSDSGGFS